MNKINNITIDDNALKEAEKICQENNVTIEEAMKEFVDFVVKTKSLPSFIYNKN